MKSLLVILPTYNESENISVLIPRIHEVLSPLITYNVLIIDDNSPDNTAGVARKMQSHYPLTITSRPSKMGLGSAYRLGFDYAVNNDFSHVLTMDADCSHNPSHMKEFLKYADDHDVVIGSRYVPGGDIENWPLRRKVLSSGANLLVRHLLTHTIFDNTSGYRLYSVSVLKNIDYKLPNEGYAYLFELAFRFTCLDVKIKEVPIVFTERRRGSSKVSRKEIFKALNTLFRLRFLKNNSVIRINKSN